MARCFKVHIFWEGHKNLAKSSPNFWPQNTQSKVRRLFSSYIITISRNYVLYCVNCMSILRNLIQYGFHRIKIHPLPRWFAKGATSRFHNCLWPSQNIWTLYWWCPFKLIFKNIIPVVTFQIGYIKNCPHPDILKMNAHFETDRTKGNRHFCLNPTGRNQPIYDNTR